MNDREQATVIRPTDPSGEAAALLDKCGLPVADLQSCESLRLFGAFDGTTLAGVIGLELYPGVALLRSLAVVPERRDSGLGKALVDFAEKHAGAEGIESIYLLTTTAAPFFARRGYAIAAREDAPGPIRTTAQFSSLCPASSTFMVKRLAT